MITAGQTIDGRDVSEVRYAQLWLTETGEMRAMFDVDWTDGDLSRHDEPVSVLDDASVRAATGVDEQMWAQIQRRLAAGSR
jgi:hypothetical protein